MFVLTSAATERKDHGFLVDAMVEQIRMLQAALDRLELHGYAFGVRTVTLRTTPERAAVGIGSRARLRG